jgi:Family of unknown function (DUF5686)/CarboxypepD_reg-like domain
MLYFVALTMNRNLLLILLLLAGAVTITSAQPAYKVYGKITNTKLEPLPFVSVQIKEWQRGTLTKENGTYEIELESGKYELLVSMVGHKTQLLTIVIDKGNTEQNIILEQGSSAELTEVLVTGKAKDKAEEYLRQVIQHKDSLREAAGAYSCNVYIKSVQIDSAAIKKRKKPLNDSLLKTDSAYAFLNNMAMAEVVLRLDHESDKRIKEERTGVTKKGNTESLFYLSTTEGDFNIYNNLIDVPVISPTPFVSPVSYSGLMAYRYKTIKTSSQNGKKVFTISIKPRQVSNATVEGELDIEEGTWVVLRTKFQLPKFHLPEYDFFEVEQQYGYINNKAWMISRQKFTYYAKTAKSKTSGTTIVSYKEYELQKQFDKKYFTTELSATTAQAYKQDSSFWQQHRTEPLTAKEIRFIQYKDSIYQATHAKSYLDSVDRVLNKVTWQKLVWKGLHFNDHEKGRTWEVQPLLTLFQPFQFGGLRFDGSVDYYKQYKDRKSLYMASNLSYGLRNKDLNGRFQLNRIYNPFNRGFFSISLRRDFQYIFQGDAWINMIKRSNIFLDNGIGIGHGLELANGLFFYTDAEIAFRRSVSDYKINDRIDSLFADVLEDNQAVAFESYNAVYGKVRLQYTPRQRYIREPLEKIIMGSAWPTFYTEWRKGIPGLFKSKVDFDYLEFGIEQQIKIGLLGQSSYNIHSGSFLNKKDLRLVDYKFQRRGDPILFLNPSQAFQALDSTFPVFKRFYQGHFVHEFNGAIINKIPLLKKIGLREVAGGGFLIAPERDLRYAEVFAGVERVFKAPFNIKQKFKLGIYAVGSTANQFNNSIQFKIGITTWNKRLNKWF